jgi:methylase of polypeptide subunit release factors
VSQFRGLTVSEAVRNAAGAFEAAGCDTPRLDAELLVAHALDTDRAGLVIRGTELLDDDSSARIQEFVSRRFTTATASRGIRIPTTRHPRAPCAKISINLLLPC